MSRTNFERLCFVCTFAVLAGCNMEASKGPILKIDRSTHEFPKTQTGELRTEFVLQNTGDGILEILDIKTSCGCAVASSPQTYLEPGEQTRIEVQVNRPPAGEKTVTVTILTNSAETPEIPIELTSWATSDESRVLRVSPSRIVFPEHSTTGSRVRLTYTTFEGSSASFVARG